MYVKRWIIYRISKGKKYPLGLPQGIGLFFFVIFVFGIDIPNIGFIFFSS